MRCPKCGVEIPLGERVCQNCGSPRPEIPPNFTDLEHKFITIEQRFRLGEMDPAIYQAEIQKLVLQDQSGNSWWLGGETGQWYWHDGQEWVPRDPPMAGSEPGTPKPSVKSSIGKRKLHWALIAFSAAFALICLCVLVLYASGVFEKMIESTREQSVQTEMAEIVEGATELPPPTSPRGTDENLEPIVIPSLALSEQQQLLVDEFSWPDSFTILEADDEHGGTVRFETWIYYGGKITYTFFDGVFKVEGDVDRLTEGFIPTPHHPDQFPLGASPDEIQALLPEHTLVPVENSDVIQPGTQIFVAQQLVLGFLENRLFYVDALTFIPDGSEP